MLVVAPDGSGARTLADVAASGIAWSPVGARLLYVPLSGGLKIVTAGGEPVRDWDGYVEGAAWSPDGSRIAFVGRAGVRDTHGLHVLDMNTGSVARLTGTIAGGTPSWSPDGRRIAFVGHRYDSKRSSRHGIALFTDVFTIAADGSQERRLTGMREVIAPYFPTANPPPMRTSWEGGSIGPTWWPDGSRLFFSRAEPDAWSLYMMNADGTCETEFRVPGFPTVTGPLWRPGRLPALPPLSCAELGLVSEPRAEAVGLRPERYGLEAINDGTKTATGVRLHVALPAGAVLADGSGRCGGTPPVCRLPQLAPGERRTVTVAVRHRRPRRQEITFRISADEQDGSAENNTARVSVVVHPCERLGTSSDDRIDGTPSRDSICGRAGSDVIRVAGGNDFVHAGTGNDHVYGGAGTDTLLGREGRDTIDGGPGRDWIAAGLGDDRVLARDGQKDVIRCEGGTDVVVADPRDIVDATCERVHRRRLAAAEDAEAVVARDQVRGLSADKEWRTVIADWYQDGDFDQGHRCRAVREARRHLPSRSPETQQLQGEFRALEAGAC